MNLLPLIITMFLCFALGFYILVVVLRRAATASAEAGSEQAIAAAVRAALIERGATVDALARERHETMETAAARASEMVDEKLNARMREGTEQLDARMRAGNEQLDARLKQGSERLEANLKLGQQKYDSSTTVIEKQGQDVRREMQRIEKMITDLQEKTSGQHGAVVNQLKQAAQVTTQLQATTGSLRDALGSAKKRGNWGERMAEDVLTHAGLVEGVNYRVQKGIDSGGRPDFTFLMPKQMVLHMDVKFPCDNYLNFLEAEEAGSPEADRFRKQFIKDARERVKELAVRKYQDEQNSVDTVVLFIPNESVFAFVQENDPGLMDVAMGSQILLCGPSTLIAVLQVVRQAMDNFMLEQRSNEIMNCLVDFKKEWVKYSDQVDKHGKHLDTALRSFTELSGARTNQLGKQVRKIDALQAAPIDAADAIADAEVIGEGAAWPPLREVAAG